MGRRATCNVFRGRTEGPRARPEHCGAGCERPPQGPPPRFELGLIQADTDPATLAECLVRDAGRGFSLCLQGPPGTGKSAFARYLAERLGLEVLQKRASDLLSPWVGETEQRIADAFAEAREPFSSSTKPIRSSPTGGPRTGAGR